MVFMADSLKVEYIRQIQILPQFLFNLYVNELTLSLQIRTI